MVKIDIVLVERDGAVARVTLNRPAQRNALSPELVAALADTLVALDDDRRVHAIVLAGAGLSFCGGYDLVASSYEPIGASDADHGRGRSFAFDDDLWKLEAIQRRMLTIFDLHTPVIAAVQGWCVAGGTDLALACDIVLAAEDARIGFPPVRTMGCPPNHMWTYLVGPQWAKRLLLTGDVLTGIDVARLGLVLDAYPADGLLDAATVLATRMARVDPHLLSANKRHVNVALELMGARTMQRLAAELDARGHLAPSMREFGRVAASDGVREAVRRRDEPFGDGVVELRWAGGGVPR